MEHDDSREQDLVEDLLAERAPALLGDLTPEEAEFAQTVALLKAARPGALRPDPDFVERLGRRLGAAAPEAPRRDSKPAQARLPAPLSRRRLLGALAGTAATGLALGGIAGHAAADDATAARLRDVEASLTASERRAAQAAAVAAAQQRRPYSVPMIGAHGAWQVVATDGELAPGAVKRFEAGALIGYLLREGDGGYRAVSAACTHMGCLLTWQDAGRRLLCPCHGSAYDETGQVVSGVARHPLPELTVRVAAGGAVQVWTVATQAVDSGVPPYQNP